MRTLETVATAPKDATFQMRMNQKIRSRVEAVYAECGLTLTDAINLFIQQSLNVEGLPFVVTPRSKAAKFKQAVGRLLTEINAGVDSAEKEGWVDEEDIIAEFGAEQ